MLLGLPIAGQAADLPYPVLDLPGGQPATVWFATNLVTASWQPITAAWDSGSYTDHVVRTDSSLFYKASGSFSGEGLAVGIGLEVLPPVAPVVPPAKVPLNLSSGFNMDSWCGPLEYQDSQVAGDDLKVLQGTMADGNNTWVYQFSRMLAGSSSVDPYSIDSQWFHPRILSSSEATDELGIVLSSVDSRTYHIASVSGNVTLPGNWLEVATPAASGWALQPNSIVIGAENNKDDWQISSVMAELPADQKASYTDVNFVLAALGVSDLARNATIAALYGASGADEEIIYSFSTADGGSGPRVVDSGSISDFSACASFSKTYDAGVGSTGNLLDTAGSLWEFSTPLSLNAAKVLWGFRFYDVDASLNWARRGLAVFGATASQGGAQTPIVDAGDSIEAWDVANDGVESVQLSATASDPDGGEIELYSWYHGTDLIATGASPWVAFSMGTSSVSVIVVDDEGDFASDETTVAVVPAPPQAPLLNAGSDFNVVDEDEDGFATVSLHAIASDPDGGEIVSYQWYEGTLIATGAMPQVTLALGSHHLVCKATDDEGQFTTDGLDVEVLSGDVPLSGIFEVWMADPEVRVSQFIYVQVGVEADRVELTLDSVHTNNRTAPLALEEVFELDYMALNLGEGPHTLTVTAYNGETVVTHVVRSWTQTRVAGEYPPTGIDKYNNLLTNGVPFFPVSSWGLYEDEPANPDKGWYGSWSDEYINSASGVDWNKKFFADWSNTLDKCEAHNVPLLGPANGQYYEGTDSNSYLYQDSEDGLWKYITTLDTNKMAQYIDIGKDHAGLLAWVWKDEPDLGSANQVFAPTEVRRWTEFCHERDPNHPTFINVVGYNYTYGGGLDNLQYKNRRALPYTFLYSNTDIGNNTMPDDYDATGRDKFLIADIISIDYYPYERATIWDWVSLEDCMLAFDRLQEWNYNLAPTINWIETGDIWKDVEEDFQFQDPPPESTPSITPHQFHNLIWLSIIHNAKGIHWFHYFGDPAIPRSEFPDENKRVAKQFVTDMDVLTSIVLGSPVATRSVVDVELGGGRVDVMVRESADGSLHIFSGNVREASESVRFWVDGLSAGQTITLYGDTRTLIASDGYFEDIFDSLDINIYQVPATE